MFSRTEILSTVDLTGLKGHEEAERLPRYCSAFSCVLPREADQTDQTPRGDCKVARMGPKRKGSRGRSPRFARRKLTSLSGHRCSYCASASALRWCLPCGNGTGRG